MNNIKTRRYNTIFRSQKWQNYSIVQKKGTSLVKNEKRNSQKFEITIFEKHA